MRHRLVLILAVMLCNLPAYGSKLSKWHPTSADTLMQIDDDIRRNIGMSGYFEGIEISDRRFTENGFAWHLVRFVSKEKPEGPLWMVPHDDESAGFDAMIAAIKAHGGVGIAVNSGTGSLRRQSGNGVCGVKPAAVTSCDPNRNFDQRASLFTSAFLNERNDGWPIIALHTNSHGFSGDRHGGRGEITVLDIAAFGLGVTAPRSGGHFAVAPKPEMANYDTLGLTAYLARNRGPNPDAEACRDGVTKSGVHFWHERVGASDGSMSNYLAINHPGISYFNAESRDEMDLSVAAGRHKIMIDAYLASCLRSGHKPVS